MTVITPLQQLMLLDRLGGRILQEVDSTFQTVDYFISLTNLPHGYVETGTKSGIITINQGLKVITVVKFTLKHNSRQVFGGLYTRFVSVGYLSPAVQMEAGTTVEIAGVGLYGTGNNYGHSHPSPIQSYFKNKEEISKGSF